MLTNDSLDVLGILIQHEAKPCFAFWLKMQARRNDLIGDLARDIKADHTARRLKTFESIELHLIKMGACQGAIKALERAGREFEREKNRSSR